MAKTFNGIDKLRAMRCYFDWLSETFNQTFSFRELEAIYDTAQAHPDWNEMADTWTDEQLLEALRGVDGSEFAAELHERIEIEKANNWRDTHGS